MYCKNCGNSVNDATVICPNCGVQVGEFKTSTPANQGESEKSKSYNTVGLVGFVLAMVGTLFWFIGNYTTAYFLYIVALLLSIAAIVCSALGMKNAKKTDDRFRSLSIAGLIVSIIIVSTDLIQLIIALAVL